MDSFKVFGNDGVRNMFLFYVSFDVSLDKYIVCNISDQALTPFIVNNYSNCE
jgi:hypothetical protein